MANRKLVEYKKIIAKKLVSDLNLSTPMLAPKLDKIVINMGLGKAVNDKKIINDAQEELTAIVGQKVIHTFARQSNASFKIRQGMAIGVKVTLRGENMYNFLDKLISIALPRIRDFRGVSPKSFDVQGNFTLGIKEHIIFPEIDFDKVSLMKGMDITFVTSRNTDKVGAKALLTAFGMPFADVKREED